MAPVAPGDGICVVVPLYNGARYVAETLRAVAGQTRPVDQVVVVDDGSTDDGLSLAAASGLAVEVIQQEHLGVAVARNRGLAAARTRWVAFLDQDDLWHPQRVERLLGWLDAHPEARLVATTEIAFSDEAETDDLHQADPLVAQWASIRVSAHEALAQLLELADVRGSDEVETLGVTDLLAGPVTVTTSFVADAALLRAAGGFAPHALAMDDYWLLVNAARLAPIHKVDQPTAFYRVHANATSRTTRLALPFLSSAVALRLGGGLVPTQQGTEPPPGPLHAHLLREIATSGQFGDPAVRRSVGHLAGLLWPDGARRQLRRARIATALPWLRPVLAWVRSLRGRLPLR